MLNEQRDAARRVPARDRRISRKILVLRLGNDDRKVMVYRPCRTCERSYASVPARLSREEDPMSDDERAIRDVIETWLTASQAGDTAKVLTLMADDVVFMVPGQEPFGKEAFASMSAGMKDMRMTASSTVVELTVLGEWAWCRNHLDVTITPPKGEAMRRSGYTLTIFRKKADGAWVIARDANLLSPKK
jgi:uncharacterized protein (TIGR02246 family)